jgi:hypothetical protein
VTQTPSVIPVSPVNFSATNRLEAIIADALNINERGGDRRPAWEQMLARHAPGLVLVVDELSEFLRAKPDNHAFSEDVRFLQFLGEWIQDKPCWVIAAMQEGIEHTGELEYSLYRKIKDRYPLRLLLTPAHVRSLSADSILVERVQPLLTQLKGIKQGERLAQRIQHHIDNWNALDKGEHALQGLEQFLFEIGSIGGFLDGVTIFQPIPDQIARLLGETQRYIHLLQHPAVRAHAAERETIVFDEVPNFEQIPAVEGWLQRAKQYYEDYKHTYRRHHDRWWKDIAEHEIWQWRPPPLGRSRHLGLRELITKIEACRQEAAKQRCRGLVNLDYQPQCHCGLPGRKGNASFPPTSSLGVRSKACDLA